MRPLLFLLAVFALSVLISGRTVQAHAGDQRSIAEMDTIIKENLVDQSLLVARGALYSRSGQWEKAKRDLSLAEAVGKKHNVAFEFAQFYYRLGEYEKALGYIDTYISVYPTRPAAFLLRARVASEAQQFRIANESYQTYFRLSANPQPGEYLAAAQLLGSTNLEGINSALALLDTGISTLGLNPQLQRYAMLLELRRDDTNGALSRWYSLKGQLGGTPEWAITLARVLILADRLDEAMLVVQGAKVRLTTLRQTPARKAAGETIAHLVRQLSEPPTNH